MYTFALVTIVILIVLVLNGIALGITFARKKTIGLKGIVIAEIVFLVIIITYAIVSGGIWLTVINLIIGVTLALTIMFIISIILRKKFPLTETEKAINNLNIFQQFVFWLKNLRWR
jgi:hypothetical protein